MKASYRANYLIYLFFVFPCFLMSCTEKLPEKQDMSKAAGKDVKRFVIYLFNNPVQISFCETSGVDEERVLLSSDYSSISCPSIDTKGEFIVFSAKLNNVDVASIFRIDLTHEPTIARKVLEGVSPFLSPDGKQMVFVRSGKRRIYNFDTGTEEVLSVDPFLPYSLVWISSQSFIYCTNDKKLLLYDIKCKMNKEIGTNIVPSSYCGDINKLLCGDFNSRVIYQLDPNTMKTQVLKKSLCLSMSGWSIYSCDGQGYIFTRQTWTNQFHLNEGQDLFYGTCDGLERHLLYNRQLLGGFCIPENVVIPKQITFAK